MIEAIICLPPSSFNEVKVPPVLMSQSYPSLMSVSLRGMLWFAKTCIMPATVEIACRPSGLIS